METARRRSLTSGQLFAAYLGLYAVGKFALTFLRTEAVRLWGLQEVQLVALGTLTLAIAWAWRAAYAARQDTIRA